MCLPFVVIVVIVVGKMKNRYFMENVFLAREIVVFPLENTYAEKPTIYEAKVQSYKNGNFSLRNVRKLRILPNHP